MQLTKHHGLGNDFLVLVGGEPDPGLARAACDRHRGIGADGLLLLDPRPDAGSDVGMVLLNADGSRAEMSGNGIGCLAQAAVLGRHAEGPTIHVRTAAGPRAVALRPAGGARRHDATVDMGRVAFGDDGRAGAWRSDRVQAAAFVDVGNPHLVLHAADDTVVGDRDWLVEVGRKANVEIDGGVNVEIVSADGGDLRMDVYERGVGLTEACGTGACAAAAAARRWELVGDRVVVHMVGGPTTIDLGGDEVLMTTPISRGCSSTPTAVGRR